MLLKKNNLLFTKNLITSKNVYGEKLIKHEGQEWRQWNPNRSKLASAILNGLIIPDFLNKKILYLGASTGTTVSHVSDLVGENGVVYAVEFAERVFRCLLDLAEQRFNVIPVFADARKPEEYGWVEECDILYVDLAQPDETEIALRNAYAFLREGWLMLAVKSRSIDVSLEPEEVYRKQVKKMSHVFDVNQVIELEPYQLDHAMILAKRK